jgi:2-C-methyl-D-erythritol 4-phosphate cytidylyltransferase/2-C-methyl-D-erythritol 2,4-cyclodiphosphate synthase
MHVAAIIAAGGRGLRLGADRPKQFLDIGGQAMLDMSVAALATSDRVSEIVVALPNEHVGSVSADWSGKFKKPVTCVAGGARRQDSVANAFASVSPGADVVLVHDAARPFVTTAVIERTIDGALAHGAAIAAIPVRDTVKQAEGPLVEGAHVVKATLRRDEIFLAQTPQAFRRDVFASVLESAGDADATDEAMLAERAGYPVYLVAGDPANVKITTADDLATAKAVALQQALQQARNLQQARTMEGEGFSPRLRIGTGYDLHRLVAGRPLILAGVTIPFELGLDGHSDADIVCHAVTDAILGAAAAGDIGRLFPDTDPQWKGADSIFLLRGAMAHVTALGYGVSNVDVTVIAQRPKLWPHLEAMRANLASALNVGVGAVSIKGKTNEGVDSTGRGESMACHAVVLLETIPVPGSRLPVPDKL